MKEVKDFCKEKGDGVSAFPDPSKGILFWRAKIVGAAGTPYAGQTYELSMEFPEDYPMRPPTVLFVTPCYHPNVHEAKGDICLDILQDKWTPVYNVRSTLVSIQSLLGDPNSCVGGLRGRGASQSTSLQPLRLSIRRQLLCGTRTARASRGRWRPRTPRPILAQRRKSE